MWGVPAQPFADVGDALVVADARMSRCIPAIEVANECRPQCSWSPLAEPPAMCLSLEAIVVQAIVAAEGAEGAVRRADGVQRMLKLRMPLLYHRHPLSEQRVSLEPFRHRRHTVFGSAWCLIDP